MMLQRDRQACGVFSPPSCDKHEQVSLLVKTSKDGLFHTVLIRLIGFFIFKMLASLVKLTYYLVTFVDIECHKYGNC